MKRIKAPPNFTLIHPTQPVHKPPSIPQKQPNPYMPLSQDLSDSFRCGAVESTGKPTFDSTNLISEVEVHMSELKFSNEAKQALAELECSDVKKYKKVLKTLCLMETNLRHPGLKTHKYDSMSGANGEDVFEAYVENKTPAAFRVFWHYGSGKGVITILAITPHP